MSSQPVNSETTANSISAGLPGSARMALIAVGLGAMLAPLNSTMIAVALPRIMDSFDMGMDGAAWLVAAYVIVMASLQPLAGRMGDLLGSRHLVLGAFAVFGVASAGAAVAPSLWPLVFFRAMQATAAAVIAPNGMALIRHIVPENRRARAFGLLAAGFSAAAAAGPPIGGVIIELAGWRGIFSANVLIVVPALVIGWKALPQFVADESRDTFDFLGAILLPLALLGVSATLISAGSGTAPASLAFGALVTAGLGVLLIRHELRHPAPAFQPGLYRIRSFSASCAATGFGNLVMYTLLLSVPLLLTIRGDSSTFESGMILVAMTGGMIVLSPVGGRLADRFGRRVPSVCGMVLAAMGAALFAIIGGAIQVTPMLVGLGLVGLGIGLSTPGLQTAAIDSVPERHAGAASGLYSTSRYFGSIVGSAMLAAMLGSSADDASGMDAVFLTVMAAAVIAVATAILIKPNALKLSV